MNEKGMEAEKKVAEKEEKAEKEEGNHCEEVNKVAKRKTSTNSNKEDANGGSDEETEEPETPSPVTPDLVDDGEEADSESDNAAPKKKVTKKKKKMERKRQYSSANGKANDSTNKETKKSKSQPFKRKKIRKILTEDKLQEETLQALKEEEDRQKRLEHQAQLAKEATQNKITGSTDFSFSIVNDDNSNFADLYGFDFGANLDVVDIENVPERDLELLSKTPPSELASLLASDVSLPNEITPLENEKENLAISSVGPSQGIPTPTPMQTGASLPSSASTSSLSNEVARLENLLRPTPPIEQVPSGGQNLSNGQAVTSSLDQTLLTSSEQTNTPTFTITPHNLQSSMAYSSPLNFTTTLQSTFYKPQPVTPVQKPAPQQSSEVICISSESSDDELVKKQGLSSSTKEPEAINISSGTDDDVIFNGTDDNEIVEDDPDVNNSGMHVDDEMNMPDANGRVLVNKNRPPGEQEIYLSDHLARAVKPHQIGGIRFMFDNIVESLEHYKRSVGFGCILAHSMGLGKTLQVIAFIDLFLRHTGARTALCVVPVNTLLNWMSEFQYWIPEIMNRSPDSTVEQGNFKVRLLSDVHKTTEARAHIISSWNKEGGVLLMGYEMFRLLTNQKIRRKQKRKQKRSPQTGEIIETINLDEEDRILEITSEVYRNLVNPGPDLIVCDEGHRIKNSQASISQALKQIATKRRIVLTGYPLQNNLMEYWCMVDFVRPNFLGTRQEFSNMFERPILNGQCADSNSGDIKLMRFRSHVLHSLLKGFVQRRSHIVLKQSLPPKEEFVLLIRLSPWQKKLYNNFIKKQIRSGSGSWCSVLNPIKAFSICCKIWNHPDVLYSTVVQKTLEEQQNNNNLIDMDLDLPDIMDAALSKSRRKKKDTSNILLSDIISRPDTTARETSTTSADGKLIQNVGLSPFGEEREKGLNYEWAKELLHDYSPNMLEMSGKMLMLMQIVHHSVASGDRILVFSQSLTTLTLIEEFLSEMQVPDPPGTPHLPRKWRKNESYFRLDGNTNTGEREKMINAFNDKNNDKIHLFLLSTRAGCLGINLVGANRVVVFDISWNPCHDAQAVCRVYRYGQTKKCVIYRLICDQTMEKKIYDRQISKQGMADRVVDELNPVLSLDRQDITKLLIYSDDEPPHVDLDNCENECSDETLVHAMKMCGSWLTKKPFQHESLLMDCKNQRLTKAEKRAAQKGYEQEKMASLSCNYSRPSYAGFYSAAKQATAGRTNRGVFTNGGTSTGDRPVANVQPVQSTPYPMRLATSMNPSRSQVNLLDDNTMSYLQRAGITVRRIVANADIPLPNASQTEGNNRPLVSSGEAFYMIHGRKGMYIGTTTGRIFALRSQKQEARNAQSPGVRTPSGQMISTREEESQVIKSVFSSVFHPPGNVQQPMGNNYVSQQPIRAGQPFTNSPISNFQNPVGPQSYTNQYSQMMNQPHGFMPGQMNPTQMQNNGNLTGLNMLSPQPRMMTLQNNMLSQPLMPQSATTSQPENDKEKAIKDLLNEMVKPNTITEQQKLPQNELTQQKNDTNFMSQQSNMMTQHNFPLMPQNNMMSHHHSSYPSLSSLMTAVSVSGSGDTYQQFTSPTQMTSTTMDPLMKSVASTNSLQSFDSNLSSSPANPPSNVGNSGQVPMTFPRSFSSPSVNHQTSSNSYLLPVDQTTPISTQAPPISIPSTNDLNFELGLTSDWPMS